MINSPIHVYDNIGTSFIVQNNKILLGSALPGYKSLDVNYEGHFVPYLLKNVQTNNRVEWEVGIGQICVDNGNVYIDRIKIAKSSNNNNIVNFSSSGNKVFYIYANESMFNIGFNNIVVRDSSFVIDTVNCVYVVDVSGKTITATLPEAKTSQGLEVRIKTVGSDEKDSVLYVKQNDGVMVALISGPNRFLDLISTGDGWIELKDQNKTLSVQSMSSDNVFSAMSTAAEGNDRSLQYNDGGVLAGSEVYYAPSAENLIGSNSSNNDLLVSGSGNRNLFFTYDGRLGLNIPSGVRPQTLFHLVNYSCQEGMRFENRSSCHPANITLYHKPSTNIDANSTVASITLAGKNSAGNKTDYSVIESKAVNTTNGLTKGQLDIVVESAGVGVTGLVVTPDQTTLGYSANNKLSISNGGSAVLGTSNNNITISSNAVNLQSQNITIGTSSGNVNIPKLNSTNATISASLSLPSITPNTLLSVNSNGVVVGGSTISVPSIPSGRVLTTDVSGIIVGSISTEDYFRSTKDFTWNKYPQRYGNICLRQIVPTENVPAYEFSVGDQIAIVINNSTYYYRNVTDLNITNNGLIDFILVDTNLPGNTVSNVAYYSITKGGYLSSTMYVDTDIVSDSTENILSIRPQKSTVFNTLHKDINFVVYGTDTVPALEVYAVAGDKSVPSGRYSNFATSDACNTSATVYPIAVTSSGLGINNTNNTANFNNTSSGVWSSMVTKVGTNGKASHYGTYDQNGNVSEWISDANKNSNNITQYAAGGAWDTNTVIGLKGLVPLSYVSGYDNVGFRVSSIYGLNDSEYITETLQLEFSSIADANDIPDTNGLYVYDGYNYLSTGVNDLGIVQYNYRLGKYEVTNAQYVEFLNAVALSDNYGLYNTNMNDTNIGGIVRSGTSGSYSYVAKSGMDDMPVVYVSYVNALRFTNWLDNGTPSGVEDVSSVLDYGSYTITETQNQLLITRNPYHHYYLPLLNEWHKAAYYTPAVGVSISGTNSAVTIRKDGPHLVDPSGLYASLSVSGYTYTDNLIVDNGLLSTESGAIHLLEKNSGILTIGSGDYRSVISTTGIDIKTNGPFNIDAQGLYTTGIYCDNITAKNIIKLDDNGNVEDTYPGIDGGVLYKDPSTGEAYAYSGLYVTTTIDGTGLAFDGTALSPLYLDQAGTIKTYDSLSFSSGQITSTVGLKVSDIQVGDDNPFYSGSILTHNGSGYAYWAPANYLNAEGVWWTRYEKRKVLVKDQELIFEDISDTTLLATEFPYTDTIAVMNGDTREVSYVKAADGNFVVDGSGNINPSTGVFYNTAGGVGMKFCPAISWANCSGVSGLAFSVNRGGYLSMEIEPDAKSAFACHTEDLASSPYTFKPSTLNVISIRPYKATAFNTLAEDIDFAIYGHKATLYDRYEPSLFDLNANGLPVGLTPAFKVNAYTANAVSGTLDDGIIFSGYTDNNSTIPSGYHFDEQAKTCINTDNPFVITTIPSGTGTLALYADLTVRQNLYAQGLIVDSIRVNPIPSLDGTGKFVVNAPLTINSSGQIVSQSPDTLPTVPGSPTQITGIVGNASANLHWAAPTKNGGRSVINYIVEYSTNLVSWTVFDRPASVDTFVLVTGLVNSTAYSFRVSAVNGVGTGVPSQVYGTITPLSTVPAPVTNLTVTRTNLAATLHWTDPSGTIIGYEISYSQNNGETWTEVSPVVTNQTATINAIANEPYYLFRVRAENSAGYGPFTIKGSIGTDPLKPIDDPSPTSVWDFGIISFTGVCI